MDAKLTLSIRPDVIAKAKEWAKGQGMSLSAAVEDLLKKAIHQSAQKRSSLDIIKELGAQMAEQAITDEEVNARIHQKRMKH